jgi:hypothetical protein
MRYCIIAGPRSGSTWLESIVFKNLENKNMNPARLGEFFQPDVAKNEQFVLSENNQIVPGKKEWTSDQEIFKDRMSMILAGDYNQSLTMRLFTQDYFFEYIDYLEVAKTLNACNFKFISLHRDIFSRALSWVVMDQTSIIHLFKVSNIEYHTTFQGLKVKTDVEPFWVCPRNFTRILLMAVRDDIGRRMISDIVDAVEINYDTISNDIEQLGFNMIDTTIFTVHELPYSTLITNYDQLLDIYKKFKSTI